MCRVARKHLIELIWLSYIQLYRQLPWFEYFFVDPVGENQLLFETDKHLGIIKSPVLILHAEDDMVVPFLLGRRVCIWCINMSLFNVVNSQFLFFCEFRHQDLE
jgi:pimeloyl-ACP methyl ester carboxylesterase